MKTTINEEKTITRDILRFLREGFGEDSQADSNNIIVIGNNSQFGDNELNNLKNQLQQQIHQTIIYGDNPLVFNPNIPSFNFSGAISFQNDAKLMFSMDTTDGCAISVNGALALNNDSTSAIDTLKSFYETWRKDWISKIPDYQAQISNGE